MLARSGIIALVTCVVGLTAPGARGADISPAWTKDFVVPIRWQRVTAIGYLLVDTRDGLYAVDPATGEVRWSLLGLGGLSEDGFDEIAGTPLALINADQGASERTVVVNMFSGALVFDSRAEQLAEISSTHVLPHSGNLLIAGFEAGKPQPMLYLYGIEDGKRRWASDAMTPSFGGGATQKALVNLLMSAAMVATDITPVQSDPIELGDGTFLLGAMGNVYRFDVASGETLWTTPYAGGSFEFRRAEVRPDVVYVGAEEKQTMQAADQTAHEYATTLYQGFRVADGEPVWKRPVKFNHPMNRLIIPIDRGLIVSEGDANKGRLQLLDYDTGEGLWGSKGKGIEIAGLVLDYAFAGSNLVLTTGYDSIWTNKEAEYLLYVLDPAAGAFRFAKPFEVKGRMLRTELADHGLTYVTTHEINVFDPASGVLKNPPSLRAKEPLATAQDGTLVYAFNPNDGFVYRFDQSTGAIGRFSRAPFEFTNRDAARALDVVDGRVVLLGTQTVAGFDDDGALAFNVHYRAPRDPAWLRSLAWAEAVRAGMASAYMGLYSAAAADVAADAEQGSATQEIAAEFSRGFGDLQQGYQGLAAEYASFARRRYEASAASRDFAFMMIQREDRSVALAQVSKRDGSIIAAIDLSRDKAPDYEVDDVASLVFYRPAETTIETYRFAPERVRVAAP
jgi:outer membrane protein assembly factor BamB